MAKSIILALLFVSTLCPAAIDVEQDGKKYRAFDEEEVTKLLDLMNAEHQARLEAEEDLIRAVQEIKKMQVLRCT